jgi:hypothetical protein
MKLGEWIDVFDRNLNAHPPLELAVEHETADITTISKLGNDEFAITDQRNRDSRDGD